METFESFVLRSPLLPYHTPLHAPFELFEQSKMVQEAIYTSSRTLYESVFEVLGGSINEKERVDKIRMSLLKYLKRLTYRSTPFGMNAGISYGVFSDVSDIFLHASSCAEKVVRLDMKLLTRLFEKLIEIEEIRDAVLWYPNNSLYPTGGTYRYFEYRHFLEREYFLSSVKRNEILDFVLRKSADGVRKMDLFRLLENQQFASDDISWFLKQLICDKILISELEPSVSGVYYQETLRDFLNRNENINNDLVNMTREVLRKVVKRQPAGSYGVPLYSEIIEGFKKIDIEVENVFHLVLLKSSERQILSRDLLATLRESLELIERVDPNVKKDKSVALDQFVMEFEQRYEGMLVPLLEALDPDIGIGYPINSNIDAGESLILDFPVSREIYYLFSYSSSFDIVMKKYYDCIKNGEIEIRFTDEDFNGIPTEKTFGEGTVTSMVSLTLDETGAINIVHLASEPSGIAATARFTDASEDILKACKDICDVEAKHWEKSDAIVAELVFLPNDSGGNLVAKPHIRRNEIPIICRSNLPSESVIPLTDILIGVRNGRLFLKSRSRDKRIECRFSSIFNRKYCQLPVFRFLYDLRYHASESALNWNWGILSNMPFHPRVKYKNVIISRAKWKINLDDVSEISKNESLLLDYFERNHIPHRFCLSQSSDFLLPIDLNIVDDRRIFIRELKQKRRITIVEDVFENKPIQVVSGPEGAYTNEVVVMWNNFESIRTTRMPSIKEQYESKKYFIPGERWVYVEIYCGQHVADLILRDYVYPTMEMLKVESILGAASWFFVRYDVPKFHIRVRVKSSEAGVGVVQGRVNDMLCKLFADNLIYDVQHRIYERELHRYGDGNIENAESFFCIDSGCVASMLSNCDVAKFQQTRWKIAVLGVDYLLDDFGYPVDMRRDLMKRLKDPLFREHRFGAPQMRWIKLKYRAEKQTIRKILERADKELEFCDPLFRLRAVRLEPVIKKMKEMDDLNELGISFDSLISSFVHMFLNRVFMNKPRLQEAIVYDLLHMHYRNEVARARHNGSMIS